MTSSWLLADAKVLRYIATLLPQRSFIFYLRIFLIFISQFSSLEESWARTRRNLVFVQTFYRVTESTLYTFLFCFALLPPNVDVVALLRLDEGISSIKYQSSISILLFCFFFFTWAVWSFVDGKLYSDLTSPALSSTLEEGRKVLFG